MLKDIILIIEEETGLNAAEPLQRSHIVRHVNLSAKRLHESTDLEGSSRSDDFNLSVGTALATFPPHVGNVRKLRYVESRLNVANLDERGRFHESGFNDTWNLGIATTERKALARDIDNVGKITFSHPGPEDHDVEFIIIGGNDKTSRLSEVVTLKVGEVLAESRYVYSTVERLMRNEKHEVSYDTKILDITGAELASFPTSFIDLKHQVVRLSEAVTVPLSGLSSRAVEVYYKKALTYMQKDYDSFVCGGDLYDECLAWEYIKEFGPSDKQAKALTNLSKILTDIGRNEDKGKVRRIDAGPNRIGNVLSGTRRSAYSYRRRY